MVYTQCTGDVTYLITLFQKHLIVFTQSDAKNDRRYVLEAMNPFFPLASLATHVEHATPELLVRYWHWGDSGSLHSLYAQLAHRKTCFVYTGGLGSRSEHI